MEWRARVTVKVDSVLISPRSVVWIHLTVCAFNTSLFNYFLTTVEIQDGKVVLGGPGSYFWQGKASRYTDVKWWYHQTTGAFLNKKQLLRIECESLFPSQDNLSLLWRRKSSRPTTQAISSHQWQARFRPSRKKRSTLMTATWVRFSRPSPIHV